MNRYTISRLVVMVGFAFTFVTGCVSTGLPLAAPTATPISVEMSQKLHNDWEFASLLSFYGSITQVHGGDVSDIEGDIALDFSLFKPPVMSLVEQEGSQHFQFDAPMPRGNSAGKVIFTASEAGDARIPRCTPVITDRKGSVLYLAVKRFHDYGEDYSFQLGIAYRQFSNMSGVFVVDSDILNDGAEHHIYGKVKLFGVTFENSLKEPLVFKIAGDKYVYVSGKGKATIGDGRAVEFGK